MIRPVLIQIIRGVETRIPHQHLSHMNLTILLWFIIPRFTTRAFMFYHLHMRINILESMKHLPQDLYIIMDGARKNPVLHLTLLSFK